MMEWNEIIVTILMISGGITLGSLVTMFITWKVLMSDRVMKKLVKWTIKWGRKITKAFWKDYQKLIEE
jgi:hypothetical protein